MSGVSLAPVAEGSAAQADRRRPQAKRLALYAVLIMLCAGVGRYGYGWWTMGRFFVTTDDAYVGGDIVTISPHVAGFVADILVTDNQHVQSGQLLARLDARDYRAALDKARAALATRVAALAGLRARSLLQQSVVAQSSADLDGKAARAAFMRVEGARYATLAVTAAGSRQEMQRAMMADKEAQAGLAGSQASLMAARQQLRVLDAQATGADAEVAQARAELERASLDMEYTTLRAPVEGYVGNRAIRAGAYVGQGSYLLSIIPAHGLWVDANFKEDQLAPMRPGQDVNLVADVVPGTVLHGRVVSMAPGTGAVFSVIPAENATGNFTRIVQRVPVRIALDPTDATLSRLRPGLSVTASVDTRTAP